MVAALKKFIPDDVGGRFAAWWDGRAYSPADPDAPVPPPEKSEKKPTKPVSEKQDTAPSSQPPAAQPGEARIAALEVLWGEGRFSPGSTELYSRLTENLSALEGGPEARFGVINADPALVTHLMGVLGAGPVIAEWRKPCASRFRLQFPSFDLLNGDIDRPSFEPDSLDMLISTDGFAFSDHKAGLAMRAFRSLKPGGQWIVLDLVRGKAKGNLAPAFASSWGEPQLCSVDEILEVCDATGFDVAGDGDDVTGDLVQASRKAFGKLGDVLDGALSEKMQTVNKAEFMREMAWEAEAWKWRERALAGELIHAHVWKFRKPAE